MKVGLILEAGPAEDEVLRVYRSQLADGDPVDLEQAFLTSLGRVLEVWAGTKGPASSTMPARLRVPEALRDIHPEGRRIRWESESQAEALAELLEQARAVVDGSPISDRSGATDDTRIERLRRALERYEAGP